MLRALISFSIREPLIMLCATALLIGFGWFSVREVPIDAIPNIGENQVIIFTAWPGRSPKDVED
ncbi:MAG TPA: metal transporter, partial [Planctomycetaceae bacterium]|nr:metal transporter [Planctomycetaceae bacterium]